MAVWIPKASIESKRLALLRHLASHCDVRKHRSRPYDRRHLLFLADTLPADQCINLLPCRGITPRNVSGTRRGYVSLVLGHLPGTDSEQGHRICIDAHRLVCWLVHGPPGEGLNP